MKATIEELETANTFIAEKVDSWDTTTEEYYHIFKYHGDTIRASIQQSIDIAKGKKVLIDKNQYEVIEHVKSTVAEQLEDNRGFWYTCSGCHDTEDGHDCGHYPHSDIFKCKQGSGCFECGGIGVLWDNIDYEKVYKDNIKEEQK